MKRCCRCKETKEFDQFHKNRSTVDGYNFICKPCKKVTARQSYERHKEDVLGRISEYYRGNEERLKEYAREYGKTNRHRWREMANERQKLREAQKKKTSVFADQDLNELVFGEAESLAKLRTEITGVPHQVDHIVPLRGKTVSGFHVWHNIRVIPRSENLSKGYQLVEELL